MAPPLPKLRDAFSRASAGAGTWKPGVLAGSGISGSPPQGLSRRWPFPRAERYPQASSSPSPTPREVYDYRAVHRNTRHGHATSALGDTATEPWVDVENGLFYRRGAEERQTNKRQPPVRLPEKLLVHMRRWQRLDLANGITHVVHADGKPVDSIRTAWEGMCEDAGLDPSRGHPPHAAAQCGNVVDAGRHAARGSCRFRGDDGGGAPRPAASTSIPTIRLEQTITSKLQKVST